MVMTIFFFLQKKLWRIFSKGLSKFFARTNNILSSRDNYTREVSFSKIYFSCINIQRSWMYPKFQWHIVFFEKLDLEIDIDVI